MARLTGFTLFVHPGRGWQMSTRERGEEGWSVQIISDEVADRILKTVQSEIPPIPGREPPRGQLNLRPRRRAILD